MREIVSPLSGFGSPFGFRRAGSGGTLSGLSITATKVGIEEAPQGVYFTATALGLPDQADAVVWWDFGDTYQFRYLPTDTKASDRQSGTAIGHRAAHVYRSAGTYTATATAYQFVNGGIVTASQTVEIVVAASDPAITERVAFSKTGSFTGAPVGATQIDWSGGVPATFTFAPNKVYYFEAGQTFDMTTLTVRFDSGGVGKITRYGAGANPVLAQTVAGAGGNFLWIRGANLNNYTVSEVDLRGTFDVNDDPDWTDTAVYPTPPPAPGATGLYTFMGANPGQAMLFYGMSISGFQTNIYPGNAAPNAVALFVDCESTNWWNFGSYSDAEGVEGYIGCHIHQKIGTQPLPASVPQDNRGWNSTAGPNTARHGPIRTSEPSVVLINKCRLLSYRSGWSSTSNPGIAAIQSALRLGTGTIPQETATLSQTDLIGGASQLTANVANTAIPQGDVKDYIVEFNYMSQDLDGFTFVFANTSKPGAHIRGNIFDYKAGIAPAFDGVNALFIGGFNTVSFGSDRPSYVYGNTLVVNQNTPGINWQTATQISSSTRPIIYENNVIQMNGTFDAAGSGSLFQTNYNPLEVALPFRPKFGSAAFGTYATGKLPALTQSGSVRTAPFSLGASEESLEPVVTLAINQTEIFGGAVLGTNVTETGTIVFAGTPALLPGDIAYNWLVNGIERADGYVVAGTDVVRARAAFTHATGEQVVVSAPIVVQAAGVAAPTLTGTPSLLASWDFSNPPTVTEVGGAVSQITGADGTSVTLAQPTAGRRPLLETVGAYKVARFVSANQMFLEATNGLGGPTQDMTFVAIARPLLAPPDRIGSQGIGIISSQRIGALSGRERKGIYFSSPTSGNNRWVGINSGTTGFVTAQTTPGRLIALMSSVTLVVNVAGPLANGSDLYIDGSATPFTDTPTGVVGTAFNRTIMGANYVASALASDGYADAEIYRVLIYAGSLNATQLEEIAVWAAANYGTPNVA
jgi:hypothetical protein